MTEKHKSDTERWTVERLIEFAQVMDQSYQQFGNDGVFDKRKLAFGARKYARTKQRLNTDTDR